MTGKDKCRMLRELRRQIAESNDIALVTGECRHKGECRGTCPKCEAELKYLEEELSARRSRGKKLALAGLAAGTALALGGCSLESTIQDAVNCIKNGSGDEIELMGETEYFPADMGDVEFEPEADE